MPVARLAIVVMVQVLLAGSVSAQTRLPQVAEEDTQVRATPANQRSFSNGAAIRQTARAQLESGLRIARFAQLGRQGPRGLEPTNEVVAVAGGAEWPDDMVTGFVVASDMAGRPLALVETPVSESGDWYHEYLHYFDTAGRTVAFERYSSFFNCPDLGRERAVTYYTRGGQIAAREYSLLEGTCGTFLYRHPYEVYADWASARRAARLPVARR